MRWRKLWLLLFIPINKHLVKQHFWSYVICHAKFALEICVEDFNNLFSRSWVMGTGQRRSWSYKVNLGHENWWCLHNNDSTDLVCNYFQLFCTVLGNQCRSLKSVSKDTSPLNLLICTDKHMHTHTTMPTLMQIPASSCHKTLLVVDLNLLQFTASTAYWQQHNYLPTVFSLP